MPKDREQGCEMTKGELHVIREIIEEVQRATSLNTKPEVPRDWAEFAWNAIEREMERITGGNHQASPDRAPAERPAKRHPLLSKPGTDTGKTDSPPHRRKKKTIAET